ncbi:MAG: hypothetical protein OCU20_09935 [Methanophagales archaeon]|nr:hypothetical protein [Methanophagales archaeon]MCW3140452.1 hypothetical protein [Methanophagales archaeon]MCW7069522.1 hypothetical protein [Methanophagales archaeon]MCW7074163.1 hypothetical protein [Methanophagales archaeon]
MSRGEIEVDIRIDGEEIEVNRFVQDMIGNAIAGAISSLKGVRRDWDELKITVKRSTKNTNRME